MISGLDDFGIVPVGSPSTNPGPLSQQKRDILHRLAFIYLRHGYARRAAALLTLLERDHPTDVPALRTLALALVNAGEAERALEVAARLRAIAPVVEPLLALIESRALLKLGRTGDARSRFRAYVAARKAARAAGMPEDREEDRAVVEPAGMLAGTRRIAPKQTAIPG